MNSNFVFSTPLPCVPLIHHNIPNLTPDDQMIPSIPLTSSMAPTRSRPRSFRLRSVFKAGQALSPMSPKYKSLYYNIHSCNNALFTSCNLVLVSYLWIRLQQVMLLKVRWSICALH